MEEDFINTPCLRKCLQLVTREFLNYRWYEKQWYVKPVWTYNHIYKHWINNYSVGIEQFSLSLPETIGFSQLVKYLIGVFSSWIMVIQPVHKRYFKTESIKIIDNIWQDKGTLETCSLILQLVIYAKIVPRDSFAENLVSIRFYPVNLSSWDFMGEKCCRERKWRAYNLDNEIFFR